MAVFMRRDGNGYYTKIEKEDPEVRKHREAQFLIYKTMKQADQIVMRKSSKAPTWLKLRISKLKVRIGKKLLRLRKTMLSGISKSKVGVYKQVINHFKSLKGLFHGNNTADSHNIITVGCRIPRPIFS